MNFQVQKTVLLFISFEIHIFHSTFRQQKCSVAHSSFLIWSLLASSAYKAHAATQNKQTNKDRWCVQLLRHTLRSCACKLYKSCSFRLLCPSPKRFLFQQTLTQASGSNSSTCLSSRSHAPLQGAHPAFLHPDPHHTSLKTSLTFLIPPVNSVLLEGSY